MGALVLVKQYAQERSETSKLQVNTVHERVAIAVSDPLQHQQAHVAATLPVAVVCLDHANYKTRYRSPPVSK